MLAEDAFFRQIDDMIREETETLAKVEVLDDLEPVVQQLMETHEAKRVLWFPSELLSPPPDTDPDAHIKALRERAEAIITGDSLGQVASQTLRNIDWFEVAGVRGGLSDGRTFYQVTLKIGFRLED